MVNVFGWQDLHRPQLEPTRIAPEVGRIARLAVSGSYLFAFFDDGTHRSYSPDGRRIEIDLPGRTVPEAVTGMVGEQNRPRVGVYAVVRHQIGREVLRRAKEAATRPTTAAVSRAAPATAPTPTEPAVQARPEPRESAEVPGTAPAQIIAADAAPTDRGFDLVVYEGARWRYVAPITGLPEGFKTDRLWLCASPQAVFMFWPVPGAGGEAGSLRCWCWREARWVVLPDMELDAPLECGAAMYLAPRIVFAAGLRGTAVPERNDSTPAATKNAIWRVWSLVDDQWRPGEPLEFDAKQAVTPDARPGRTALAALGQNVFVATLGPGGEIEAGIWPPEGGAPKRRFEVTRVFDLPRKPLLDPRTRDLLGLIIVLAVLVLVFWQRQESLSTPALLPKGLMLAAYWKRLVGTGLDLLPAIIVTSLFWHASATAYYEDLVRASATWKDTMPSAPDRLLVGWLLIRIVYAIYCAAFEWTWGATPGKRFLGCRVLSETGRPPSLREIAVRNAMRVVELEPYLPIWPLLLIMFFTRNRQRLGDLLARTVVVEPGERVSRVDSDDDMF